MQIEDLEMTTKILAIVENYSKKWLERTNSTFIDLVVKEKSTDEDHLNWHSPENIESGLSGVAILFIEIFKKTGDRKYFGLAEKMIAELITYSKNTPTNNYSLYTGRGGVVYAIIQFYGLTRDETLIADAFSIIQAAGTSFLDSEYVNDSLYEGRAGTLLMLYSVYELMPDRSLLEDIHLFTWKIIANAQLNEDGLHWQGVEEINIRGLCGFAHGGAGIRYVLNKIGDSISPEVLLYLKTKISLYEGSCWVDKFQNWGNFRKEVKNNEDLEKYKLMYVDGSDFFNQPLNDFSWSDGTIGIGLSRLFSIVDTENITTEISNISEILRPWTIQYQGKKTNLFNGLAGIGCFFLLTGRETYNSSQIEMAMGIADEILRDLSKQSDIGNGFLHGNLGCLYFLLLTIRVEDQEENLLCPMAKIINTKIEIDPDLSLSVGNIRRKLLEKFFPRTIYFLVELAPAAYHKFFFESYIDSQFNEISYFVSFMSAFLQEIHGSSLSALLADLFNLENSKYRFGNSDLRSKTQIYFEELIRHGDIINLINTPFNDFSTQPFIRSGASIVISMQWDWSVFEQPMKKKHPFENLHLLPETVETMFWISFDQGVEDIVLDKEGSFIWHFFKHKTTIIKALKEIRRYYETMDHEDLAKQIKESKSKNADDYWSKFQYMLVYKIKEWLYTGVLKVTQ